VWDGMNPAPVNAVPTADLLPIEARQLWARRDGDEESAHIVLGPHVRVGITGAGTFLAAMEFGPRPTARVNLLAEPPGVFANQMPRMSWARCYKCEPFTLERAYRLEVSPTLLNFVADGFVVESNKLTP